MATAALVGKGSYVYFGRESGGWGNGDPSSDRHMAFNPMTELSLKLPKYVQQQVTLFSELDHSIEFDEKLDIAKVSIRTLFRDPFLLLCLFTHKTVTSPWTGTGDNIAADFSDTDDEDTLWMQVHVHNQDGTNHLNLLFTGGEIISYGWVIEQGKPMYEEVELQFKKVSENTQAVDIDDGFDDGSFDGSGLDGGFAMWDGAYSANDCALSKDCTITWGGSAISGLNVKKCEVKIEFNKVYEWIQSSLEAQVRWADKRSPFKATVEGIFKGNQDLSEFLAAYSSKTKQTFKVQYGTTKYLQFTNAYISDIEGLGIPAAGEALKGTYTFVSGGGGVASYSWTANEATDPRNFITY